MSWSVYYKKAYDDNGELFFPEKLSHEFLEGAKRSMGTYLFANQYLNEVFPSDEQIFKPTWLKPYTQLPGEYHTFAFIDPAISTEDGADYTALSVVSVTKDKDWYLRIAKRARLTPTEIITLCFEVNRVFKPKVIGIETVGFQEALIYMLNEEMRRRNEIIPVSGIKTGTDKTKEMRIMSLVPRFEWGHIFVTQGLTDFEKEYLQFPRGSHDDILDSLSQIESIVYYPTEGRVKDEKFSPHDPRYESQYIRRLAEREQTS